ncbi:MAG: pitrilysin family protein [Acidobacteriota bacterium]
MAAPHPSLIIPFEHYRLTNGLQVILHQDRKLPIVHVNLWYHVGSKNERPGRTGFAHLFEHMMFQGSKNADGGYLTLVEKAGANLRNGGVNGTTSFDRTNYFETVPREALEYVLWLESDRMGYLTDALTQEKLDNQRDVVKNERRQSYENVPYGRAFEVILANTFPKGHPYSWLVIGSQEDISAATLEDVIDFFKTYYTPNNCSLAVAGDFEREQVVSLVERYFGPLPPGPALERPRLWLPKLEGQKRVVVSDRVPQERLYLVWPTPAYFQPGDAELDIASRILSHGKNSRLYKTLVYDTQIASDVSAFNYSLEISGLFGVIATARPGHSLEEIEETIRKEISRFAREGPNEEELAREKAKQEFDFISGLERIGGFGGKADLLNGYNTFLGDPDYFQKDFERYGRLTADSIRACVGQYLDHQNQLALTFVPEASDRPNIPEIDRRVAPALGAKAAFHPPPAESMQLGNGLQVIVITQRELPKVAASLVLKSGGISDPSGLPGVAWMTGQMLDEGTSTRTALQIQAQLDRMGTILSTHAEAELSHVSFEALTQHLEPSLQLMADLVLDPVFPEEELERNRKKRLDSILQERNNPAVIGRKAFRIALFGPDHPFGRDTAGTETSLQALRSSDLQAFYQTYWKPNIAALIFAGDIDLEDAVRYADRYFGGWLPAPVSQISVPLVEAPQRPQLFLVDRQGAPQSQIRIGGLGPKRKVDDFYAIELMNAVLGGAFGSRLNLNLREDKGYTYGAFSSFSFARDLGLWVCGAGVQTQFTKATITEIRKELESIRDGLPITDSELDAARANLTRGFAQRFETLGRLVDEVAETFSYDLPIEEIARYPQQIESTTLEEVRAAVQKYIDFGRTICVVVGDKDQIEGDLRELSWCGTTLLDVDGNPVPTSKTH